MFPSLPFSRGAVAPSLTACWLAYAVAVGCGQSKAPDTQASGQPTSSLSPPASSGGSGSATSGGSGSATAGGSGSATAGGSGSATSGASEPTTMASESEGGAPPGEPGVRFVGRFEVTDSGEARFAWSGSATLAAFEGSAVSVRLNDSGSNWFAVVVDGELQPALGPNAGSHSYPLASGLAPGRHEVGIYRRTEASQGDTTFQSFEFPDGTLLAPPPPKQRTIEILGDSITCGYGNEGTTASCPFTPDTENHYLSYGAIAARALDADLVTVAWSGKGIVSNYGTDTYQPLPELFGLTLPAAASSELDFHTVPDVVVINLGTNDYSTDDDPTLELFADHYVALLTRIRTEYPNAYVLCTVGPMLGGSDLEAARAGIRAAVDARALEGDTRVGAWEMNIGNDSPGCDYHPSLATHRLMADALVGELRQRLAW